MWGKRRRRAVGTGANTVVGDVIGEPTNRANHSSNPNDDHEGQRKRRQLGFQIGRPRFPFDERSDVRQIPANHVDHKTNCVTGGMVGDNHKAYAEGTHANKEGKVGKDHEGTRAGRDTDQMFLFTFCETHELEQNVQKPKKGGRDVQNSGKVDRRWVIERFTGIVVTVAVVQCVGHPFAFGVGDQCHNEGDHKQCKNPLVVCHQGHRRVESYCRWKCYDGSGGTAEHCRPNKFC